MMEMIALDRKPDNIDYRILRELTRDGRLTHNELSEKVGLSPSPSARRVKRLEEEGVITGYHAFVDESKLGFAFNVFVSVRLHMQTEQAIKHFEETIVTHDEVVDCWLMTGTFDYLIRLVLKDLNEFETFLNKKLTRIESLASCESSIPIRRLPCQSTRLQ